MKTIQSFLIICAVALFSLASCKKDHTAEIRDVRNTRDFIQKRGPQKETFSFNTSDLPKTITLRKGTTITIPEGAFTLNGNPVSGAVTMETYEMIDRSDIISAGGNTNHISGAPLHSDGFIFMDVKSNGQSVDQTLAKPVKIAIPAKRDGSTLLWQGVIDEEGQFAWAPPPQGNQRETKGQVGDAFRFDFGQLGWVNCDVLWEQGQPQTTFRVKVLNNPGTFANFRGFDGETFVFFCGKGANVAAHIYTPDGEDQVKSYDNMMPMGVEGRLLVFSVTNGKFYLATKDITITDNHLETVTLTETTEAAIQAAIDQLDNY